MSNGFNRVKYTLHNSLMKGRFLCSHIHNKDFLQLFHTALHCKDIVFCLKFAKCKCIEEEAIEMRLICFVILFVYTFT